MDDLNSFDDQYLAADDVHRLLEALDYFINRDEGNWERVDQRERDLWAPYRVIRARLQERLGIRMWDDAGRWLEALLRKERNAALQAFRREVDGYLNDRNMNRNELRRRMMSFCDEVAEKQLTDPRPSVGEWSSDLARRERSKQPFGPGNWRRRERQYGPDTEKR